MGMQRIGLLRPANWEKTPAGDSVGSEYAFDDYEVGSSGSAEIELDHGSFVGLAIKCDDAATVAVTAGVVSGSTPTAVTLNGTGTAHRYPDADGMNILYNAAVVKITWDQGAINILQKG